MIIFFSANGNTQWCATEIAKATADKAISMVELGNLQKLSSTNESVSIALAPNEPLGIFFPVHGWKPPRTVLDFISKMKLSTPPSYCYSVCTCGDSIGDAMSTLSHRLARHGISLNASFSIIMPETYVCLPFMYTDSIDNEHRKVSEARQTIARIASYVNSRRTNVHQLVKGPILWFFTHVIGSFFNKFMITDRPFRIDKAKCIKCKTCANVCPMGNIYYDENSLPKWQRNGRCTSCMACYHHCPKHAINYGNITRHRGQYYFGIHSKGGE